MAVFYSSLISYFPGVLLRYFLNGFEMFPVPVSFPVVYPLHVKCNYIKKRMCYWNRRNEEFVQNSSGKFSDGKLPSRSRNRWKKNTSFKEGYY
jgi:hypothetical protein